MKFCSNHWKMCGAAVEKYGMTHLIAKDGKAALDAEVRTLQSGEQAVADFDPLMSMNWHWMNHALSNGGLYLMNVDVTDPARKENHGHYCPVCEYEKHSKGFVAVEAIDDVAQQMATWCRQEGLIGKVN